MKPILFFGKVEDWVGSKEKDIGFDSSGMYSFHMIYLEDKS
jgi:hypothetical protein